VTIFCKGDAGPGELALMHQVHYFPGDEKKDVPKIARLSNVSIYVHADEHAPPHFHVWGPNSDAQVRIDNLQIMNGQIHRADQREIFNWAFDNQGLLQSKWDEYNERD
jgi:hypothetical protein